MGLRRFINKEFFLLFARHYLLNSDWYTEIFPVICLSVFVKFWLIYKMTTLDGKYLFILFLIHFETVVCYNFFEND